MSIDHTERWFFHPTDTPARFQRTLRTLVADKSPVLSTTQHDEQYCFTVRCEDETAVFDLLEALGASPAHLIGFEDHLHSRGDLSDGIDIQLVVCPDWDGSFEWVLEIVYELPNEWPMTMLVAQFLAEKLGGKHYDDLNNEELLAGQTMWIAPPPIIRVTRTP